jgi:hypothetical protein
MPRCPIHEIFLDSLSGQCPLCDHQELCGGSMTPAEAQKELDSLPPEESELLTDAEIEQSVQTVLRMDAESPYPSSAPAWSYGAEAPGADRDGWEYKSCAICGIRRREPALGSKTDHLRTVCVRNHALESGYFRPHLNENERFVLQQPGEYLVCTNRKACRYRQACVRSNAALAELEAERDRLEASMARMDEADEEEVDPDEYGRVLDRLVVVRRLVSGRAV